MRKLIISSSLAHHVVHTRSYYHNYCWRPSGAYARVHKLVSFGKRYMTHGEAADKSREVVSNLRRNARPKKQHKVLAQPKMHCPKSSQSRRQVQYRKWKASKHKMGLR